MIKTKRDMDRPAELGIIRIGKKDGKRPVRLDHFLITQAGEPDFELMEKLDPPNEEKEKKGYQPREIDIFLPFDNPADNFHTSRTMYGKTRLADKRELVTRLCHCDDGEIYHRLIKGGGGEDGQCPGDDCEFASREGDAAAPCKFLGRLYCIIARSPIIGGFYRFQTTSANTIRSINTSLQHIAQITSGFLAGLPLKMVVRPQNVTVPNVGGQQTIYVVNIEFHGIETDFMESALKIIEFRESKKQAFIEQSERAQRLLIAPESEKDSRETAEEFYHDTYDNVTVEVFEPGPELPEEETEESDPQGTLI